MRVGAAIFAVELSTLDDELTSLTVVDYQQGEPGVTVRSNSSEKLKTEG